jgi:hypothetical protein
MRNREQSGKWDHEEDRGRYDREYYARADYDDYHQRHQLHQQSSRGGYYGDEHRFRRGAGERRDNYYRPDHDTGYYEDQDRRRREYGYYEPHHDYPRERGRVGSGYQDYSGGPRNKSSYGRDWQDREEYYDRQDRDNYYKDDYRGSGYGADDYDDREYRHYGYQSTGETVGFGYRPSRRNANDWRMESEYRGGHAFNRRGYGKHGAR